MIEEIIPFKTTVFVGQPEYFRQAYYDAIHTGDHFSFEIRSGDLSPLKALPEFLAEKQAKCVVIFRPEWLSGFNETLKYIKKNHIKLVGFSSEPLPLNGVATHPDQITRLHNLKAARDIPYDLLIHFDPSSSEILSKEFSNKIAFLPLPVSYELFKPRPESEKEFDLCFMGRSTDHREEMMSFLKAKYNLVHVAHGLNDEWACSFMNKSKIVLNIHNHTYLNFETRTVQALLCNRLTLSENLSNTFLTSSKKLRFFDSKSGLEELVQEALRNHSEIKESHNNEELRQFNINRLFELIQRSV